MHLHTNPATFTGGHPVHPTHQRRWNPLQRFPLKATLAVVLTVMVSMLVGASVAKATPQLTTQQFGASSLQQLAAPTPSAAPTCKSITSAKSRSTGREWNWLHYNVDPYYPNLQNVASYKHALRAKRYQAAGMLGIPMAAWKKLEQTKPCAGWIYGGQKLDAMMSGGFWGSKVKVEHNVRVKFTSGRVPAWYAAAIYGGKMYILVTPTLCGNLSVIVVPAPVTQQFYVWAWKEAKVGNQVVKGQPFPVYAHGNRHKQWTMVSDRWTRLGPFQAGHIPKVFCEVVKAPWKARGSACQSTHTEQDRLVVLFANFAPGKGAPAPPTPTPPPTAENNCLIQGGTWNGNTQLCTIIQVVGNCTNVTIINGNGNTVSQTQNGTCSTPTSTPPPQSNFACTGFSVTPDTSVNLKVNAHVDYSASNATLQNVRIDWGDGAATNDGVNQSHTYSSAGSRTVSASLTFNLSGGGQGTATCSAQTVTPKDSTQAPTTTGSSGGTGAGGSPGPTTGTGQTCRKADGSVGTVDQFGHCN